MNNEIAMVYAMLSAVDNPDGASSGILYAGLMTKGVDIYQFERLVAAMLSAGLITSKHHVVHVTDKGRQLVKRIDTALQAARAV